MQSSKGLFFYEKCRLCLERPGVRHIFEEESLQNDVFQCTGVKVNVSDNLPQKICSNCSEVIANAKELRLLANKNDVLLKSLFANDDDDSEDHLVIDESVGSQESQTVEKNTPVLETQKKKCKAKPKKVEKANSIEQNEPTSSTTGNIRVRKDLVETPSKAKKPRLSVTTKSEYDEIRKKIKLECELENISFKCEICSKTFETWKKLYLHTRGHNKSIACPLDACGKKFATKGDLEKHLRTHTGVRPYVCEVCDKSFTQQGTLKSHKENLHNIYTFLI